MLLLSIIAARPFYNDCTICRGVVHEVFERRRDGYYDKYELEQALEQRCEPSFDYMTCLERVRQVAADVYAMDDDEDVDATKICRFHRMCPGV